MRHAWAYIKKKNKLLNSIISIVGSHFIKQLTDFLVIFNSEKNYPGLEKLNDL